MTVAPRLDGFGYNSPGAYEADSKAVAKSCCANADREASITAYLAEIEGLTVDISNVLEECLGKLRGQSARGDTCTAVPSGLCYPLNFRYKVKK
jgi:hypothetical protein